MTFKIGAIGLLPAAVIAKTLYARNKRVDTPLFTMAAYSLTAKKNVEKPEPKQEVPLEQKQRPQDKEPVKRDFSAITSQIDVKRFSISRKTNFGYPYPDKSKANTSCLDPVDGHTYTYDKDGYVVEERYDENGKRAKGIQHVRKYEHGFGFEVYPKSEQRIYPDGGKLTVYWNKDGSVKNLYRQYFKNREKLNFKFDNNSKLEYCMCIKYDKQNHPTQEISYNAKGEIQAWKEFEYDENGNKTREICYRDNGKVNFYWDFEYDKNNCEIRGLCRDGVNNRLQSERYCNEDGNMVEKSYLDFNSDGKALSEYISTYDGYSNIELSWEVIEYDNSGRKIMDEFNDNSSNKRSENRYVYNKNGVKIEERREYYEAQKGGKQRLTKNEVLKYDAQGNFVCRLETEYINNENGSKIVSKKYDKDDKTLLSHIVEEYGKDNMLMLEE